jgi:hypothetical protein
MTQPVATFVWDDPPPTDRDGRPRYDWSALARQCREHPMQYAKVFDRDRTSLATAIRIGGIKVLRPELGFEVKTANNTRGNPLHNPPIPRTCTMWVRYNPDKDVSN